MGRVSLFLQLVLVIRLALAVAVASPAAAEGSSQPVPGWYNYQTKVFTPAAQPPPAAAGKPVTVKGTLIIKATVSLDGIPKSQKVLAFPSAFLFDASNSMVSGVSEAGFKTIIKPDIILNVLDARAINFDLPVGAASETVTVQVQFVTQQSPSFPSALFSKTIPLPADGATTVVTLPAAL